MNKFITLLKKMKRPKKSKIIQLYENVKDEAKRQQNGESK